MPNPSLSPPSPPTRRVFLAGAAACAVAASSRDPARAQTPPGQSLALTPRPAAIPTPSGQSAPGALSFFPEGVAPLLHARAGEPLSVDLSAPPDAALAIHWQGLRIANAADGAPPLTGPALAPGARATVRFVPPDPGFYLGRPAGPHAGALLARGLCAPLLVAEAAPPPVDLDLTAVLSDARLGADGALAPDDFDPLAAGRVGDLVLVNGAPTPLRVEARPNARLRLRVANATPARLMIASVEGAAPLVIAVDGQPCEPFEPVRDTIPIGPAARFELMLDLPDTPGEARLVLRGARPPDAEPQPDLAVVRVAIAGPALPQRANFEGLPANGALPAEVRLQRARRADLVIEGGRVVDPALAQALAMGWRADLSRAPASPWRLDGRADAPNFERPLFKVKRGTPVTLGFVNRTAFPQTTHVHGHVMRLLHPLDDGWEPYWRDSVMTSPGKTSRVAFIADNPGRWMIANADPDRAAAGLATWFEVV